MNSDHPKDDLLKQIRKLTGPGGLLVGDDVRKRPDNWISSDGCLARALVRPSGTDQVSSIMKLCHAAGQTVVAHGGVTGLAGGAIAGESDLVLSLERLSGIAAVDRSNSTVLVEAGAVLQSVQEAAEEAGLMFPLDLGARGSATIGGVISTNAGGNSVIRYGMMREQVLGVEAVLADGTVVSSLKPVIKNNTGYDLKQLFIGSEGTLGIITRAVLRLRPQPRSRNTALVALEEFDELGLFLRDVEAALGGTLSAFEVMWNDFYRLVVGDGEVHGQPLAGKHRFYVLLEATGGHEASDGHRFEDALHQAMGKGWVRDAVIAQSRRQRNALWAIRDDIDRMVNMLSPEVHFDVSLDFSRTEEFVEEVRAQLAERWPGSSRMVAFGHLGDGNIHLVMTTGSDSRNDLHEVERMVYESLARRQGVISAEHGIGLEKKAYLRHSRSAEEIRLMKTLKQALDPLGLLNPGKIFDQNQGD
jgi:FAD/FMN-containing dehydrogenase